MSAQLQTRIRELRSQRGLSQKALSQVAGVDTHAIGKLERGETNVLLSNLLKVAQGLDEPLASVLGWPRAAAAPAPESGFWVEVSRQLGLSDPPPEIQEILSGLAVALLRGLLERVGRR